MRRRHGESGMGILELTISATLFTGALLITLIAQASFRDQLIDSERRIQKVSTAMDMLDRIDGLLRSSSHELVPFRVFDPQDLVGIDLNNDTTQTDPQAGEQLPVTKSAIYDVFMNADVLEDEVTVPGIWFQRIKDVDDSRVPPVVVYERPSYLGLVREATEQDDGKDNDGDGLVDEGQLVLLMDSGELVVARGVTKFTIVKHGDMLEIVISVQRSGEKVEEGSCLTVRRFVYVNNW